MRETAPPSITRPRPRARHISAHEGALAAPRMAAAASLATPERTPRVGRLETPPVAFVTRAIPEIASPGVPHTGAYPVLPASVPSSLGSATARAGVYQMPPHPAAFPTARPTPNADPDVWLIALPTASGGYNSLEGAGHAGPIRVSRPYGHLRSIRPVTLSSFNPGGETTTSTPRPRRSRAKSDDLDTLGTSSAMPSAKLPAGRPLPAIVSAVEVETDTGLFRVERPDSVLSHSDLAWAMAHLETGEPDPYVPLPRRQLALLLTLLPTPQNPEHPERDPMWGWAHRLRSPWERGPLHTRGRLGRLIAFDPDDSGKGLHRACFELLGSEEVVWAVGVPCFRPGSVYELVPLGKGLHPSRWLHWPLGKGRAKAGVVERPAWEIARVVFRVGAPRWPLAGVVEPLGPLGVAG